MTKINKHHSYEYLLQTAHQFQLDQLQLSRRHFCVQMVIGVFYSEKEVQYSE